MAALEKWKEIIGRTDKKMTLKDYVCELHFEKNCIIRHYEHRLKDGSLFKFKRGVPCLIQNAEPTRFLLQGIEPISILLPGIETSKILTKGIESPNMCSNEDYMNNSKRMKIYKELSIVSSEYMVNDEFNFKYLSANVSKISLPSASWGISFICEYGTKYVMCAKWDTYVPERRLVIDGNLNIKIFLKDREISHSVSNKVKCMDDVCDLLKRVDHYVLCSGIDDKKMVNCELYTERSNSSLGRPTILCKECSSYIEKKKPVSKKSSCNYIVCGELYLL